MSTEHGSPESLHVNVKLSRNVFSPSPMGLVLTISALESWAIRALDKEVIASVKLGAVCVRGTNGGC